LRPHTGKLAHVRDEQGREAIALCHAAVRAEFEKRIYFDGRYELREGPAVHKSATALVVFADDHGAMAEYERAFDEATAGKQGGMDAAAFHLAARAAGVATKDSSPSCKVADADTNENGKVEREEFARFCCRMLHGSAGDKTRRVVLKFMSEQDQFERERDFRKNSDLEARYVVGAIRYMPDDSDDSDGKKFALAIKSETSRDDLERYKYAIVMPAADRNLQEIFVKERPDVNAIRHLMRHVGEALQHLHKCNIMQVCPHSNLSSQTCMVHLVL